MFMDFQPKEKQPGDAPIAYQSFKFQVSGSSFKLRMQPETWNLKLNPPLSARLPEK
jgi:hypothetical protein